MRTDYLFRGTTKTKKRFQHSRKLHEKRRKKRVAATCTVLLPVVFADFRALYLLREGHAKHRHPRKTRHVALCTFLVKGTPNAGLVLQPGYSQRLPRTLTIPGSECVAQNWAVLEPGLPKEGSFPQLSLGHLVRGILLLSRGLSEEFREAGKKSALMVGFTGCKAAGIIWERWCETSFSLPLLSFFLLSQEERVSDDGM